MPRKAKHGMVYNSQHIRDNYLSQALFIAMVSALLCITICSIPNTLVQKTFLISKSNDQTPLRGLPSKPDNAPLSQEVPYFVTPEA
jgi:hypothetical protein